MKSRTVATILAFVFSFIGAHNFYLGKTGKGLLCLIFCWTYIPTLMSLFDLLRFLTMSDQDFDILYNNGASSLPGPSAPVQTTQAQNVTINLGSELQKLQLAQQSMNQQQKCYIEQIEALSELHKKGILTDDEFARKKQDLLG